MLGGWMLGLATSLLLLLAQGTRRSAAPGPESRPGRPSGPPRGDGGGPPLAWDPAPREHGLRGGQIALLIVVVALLTALGAGVGYGMTHVLEKQYAARAEILYPIAQESPTGFLREDRNLTTQVVLLRSRAVIAPVAADAGLTPEELGDRVGATVIDGSEVLRVEVRDPDEAAALDLTRGLVRRYMDVASERAGRDREYLSAQLALVQRRLGRVAPGSSAEEQLAARRGALLERLDELALAGPPARLVAAPYPVGEPVSPRPLLAGAAGGLCGLLIGAGAAALLGRRWARR